MARSRTSRFNLWRWSSDADTQQRSDFDDISAEIEARGAKASHGAIGARPTADASNRDSFFLVTDATGGGVVGTLYYCDGATWTKFASDSFVGCKVRRTTTQSVATATSTAVTFTAEDFDTNAFHDLVTNPSRLTVPAGLGGYYHVGATIPFEGFGSGDTIRMAIIRLNGGAVVHDAASAVATGQGTTATPSTILNLVAGDYLDVAAYHEWGGSLNIDPIYGSPSFWLRRLGS